MYKDILVPVLFDQDGETARAIDAARALLSEDGKITLLHVIEYIPDYAAIYLPDDFVAKKRQAIEAQMAELVKGVQGAEGAVVAGHAGRAILDWSSDHRNDCVVTASHRPGMQDLLLGSTAAKVVRHAICAVHVLR